MQREVETENGIIRHDGEGWEVVYYRPHEGHAAPGAEYVVGLRPGLDLALDCSDQEAREALVSTLRWEGVEADA